MPCSSDGPAFGGVIGSLSSCLVEPTKRVRQIMSRGVTFLFFLTNTKVRSQLSKLALSAFYIRSAGSVGPLRCLPMVISGKRYRLTSSKDFIPCTSGRR
jgi:hypothetical protein